MSDKSVIIWTPQQRKDVVKFMRLYADQLEKEMDDADRDYGLRQVQSGVLHVVDMLLPSGLELVVNQGPKQAIRDGVKVLLTDDELQAYEDARQGEA